MASPCSSKWHGGGPDIHVWVLFLQKKGFKDFIRNFAVNVGTNIYAPADGKIKFVGNQGGFGKVLKIDHGNGNRTLFAHLSKIKVDLGSSVKRGDLVAISGNTGRSAGPHLHYEVKYDNKTENPRKFYTYDKKLEKLIYNP